MKDRLFWDKRTLKKYRIIFETEEMVVGADRKNKYQTFRKDTGLIAYSRREVLEMSITDLTKTQKTREASKKHKQINGFDNPVLGLNFG